MTKIPKIIHYMWMGKKMPEDVKKNIESWKKYCPDYTFMEWNETNFDVNAFAFSKEAYKQKKYAFVADFVRIYAIKKYGGIWLDTDVELFRPLDDFLDYSGFIGFENEAHLATSTMGFQKKSKFIDSLYDYYSKRVFDGNKNAVTPNTIIYSVILHKHYGLKYKNTNQVLDSNIHVFTKDYFLPQDYTTGKTTLTENSYAIHKYGGTWQSKGAKFVASLLKGLRYMVGNKIFGDFTRLYVKSKSRSVLKEFDRTQQ